MPKSRRSTKTTPQYVSALYAVQDHLEAAIEEINQLPRRPQRFVVEVQDRLRSEWRTINAILEARKF
jgi:hypothetical protein